MDGTGSGVTNRVRIGSHTASDVRRIPSRMHCTHTPRAWLRPANAHPHVEIAREEPVTKRRSQPVPASRELPDDPRSHGANVR